MRLRRANALLALAAACSLAACPRDARPPDPDHVAGDKTIEPAAAPPAGVAAEPVWTAEMLAEWNPDIVASCRCAVTSDGTAAGARLSVAEGKAALAAAAPAFAGFCGSGGRGAVDRLGACMDARGAGSIRTCIDEGSEPCGIGMRAMRLPDERVLVSFVSNYLIEDYGITVVERRGAGRAEVIYGGPPYLDFSWCDPSDDPEDRAGSRDALAERLRGEWATLPSEVRDFICWGGLEALP